MTSKKFFIIFISFILIIPIFVYSKVCDNNIKIKSIELSNKSKDVVELDKATINDKNININSKLYSVNDFIEYRVAIKNDSVDEYIVDNNTIKIDSDYIDYSLKSTDNNNILKPKEEKNFNLRIEYVKEIDSNKYSGGKFIDNKQILLNLSSDNNPTTFSNIFTLIVLCLLFGFGVYSLLHLKNKSLASFLIILSIIIPIQTYAICIAQITLDSHVEIGLNKPNNCTFDGDLVDGVEFINGPYTYRYKQHKEDILYYEVYGYEWRDMDLDGWGVALTDSNSTDSVDAPLCTSINNKPVVSTQYAFVGSRASSIDLSTSNTENVVTMEGMFLGTSSNELKIKDLNTSNVTNMYQMFYGNSVPLIDISGWDTSKVENMQEMFSWSSSNSINVSNLNNNKVENMFEMFYNSRATSIDFTNFGTPSVNTMMRMFMHSDVQTLDLSSFDTSNVTTMFYMFCLSKVSSVDLSSFNTSNLTDMYGMFSSSNIEYLDLSNFDTSNVINMASLFSSSKAKSIDLSSFDTSKVENMSYMFYNSSVLELDISHFNTSNVSDMSHMFESTVLEELDLSNFDTSKVTNMKSMFDDAKIHRLDVSSFDTSKVADMSFMFEGLELDSLNITNFDTSKVTTMRGMFRSTKIPVLDLSSFDTTSVTDTTWLFTSSTATIGYARTEADMNKFNSLTSYNKPSSLVFTLKEV